MDNDTPGLNHNQPPPHEAMALHVEDLFQLVSDTTEGAEVLTDEQEAALDALLDDVKSAAKDSEAQRKAEKEPHLEAGRQIDANWKPIKERLDMAAAEIKKLLTPYRVAKQKARDEAARKAREEADAREEAARAKLKEPEHLQARFDAEEDLKAANKLKATANRTEREATGLRTYKVVTVTNHRDALKWIMAKDPNAVSTFVEEYAQRNAKNRPMDGVTVTEEKRVA